MATNIDPAPQALPNTRTSLPQWVKRHDLLAFFLLAFALPWSIWIPMLVLSRNGLGLFPFQAPATLLAIIGGFGPAISAIIVTGAVEGKAAVTRLLRRCIQWRVGLHWYLLAIFLVPVAFLFASILLGGLGYSAVLRSAPLLLTFYPFALIAQVILAGGLGEEPGWRGFALPRLQPKLGPISASVLLGIVQACWHIPLFFVADLSQSHFSFIRFVLIGIAISVLLTWVYNGTGGSLLLVMLFHEAEDTTSALSLRIAPAYLERTPAYLLVYATLAILILLLTRGTLLYRRSSAEMPESEAAVSG